jgi:hypothetical protein
VASKTFKSNTETSGLLPSGISDKLMKEMIEFIAYELELV